MDRPGAGRGRAGLRRLCRYAVSGTVRLSDEMVKPCAPRERHLRAAGVRDDGPLEVALEIGEALLADPGVAIIRRDVSRIERRVVGLLGRDLSRAERAMVVVPAFAIRPPPGPPEACSAPRVGLPVESPVVLHHVRKDARPRLTGAQIAGSGPPVSGTSRAWRGGVRSPGGPPLAPVRRATWNGGSGVIWLGGASACGVRLRRAR